MLEKIIQKTLLPASMIFGLSCASGGNLSDDSTIYPFYMNDTSKDISQDTIKTCGVDLPKKKFYLDNDHDSYGDNNHFVLECLQPEGYVTDNTDCNDKNPLINPGAEEICNGKDENCNLQADEGLKYFDVFKDDDGDGEGDPEHKKNVCSEEKGWVKNNNDCNDDPKKGGKDIKTGSVLWRSDISCSPLSYISLIHLGQDKNGLPAEYVISANSSYPKGNLYLLDYKTGEVKTEWENKSSSFSNPVAFNGIIYVTEGMSNVLTLQSKDNTSVDKSSFTETHINLNKCKFGWASGGPEYSFFDFVISLKGDIYGLIRQVDTDWVDEYCSYIIAVDKNGLGKWTVNSSGAISVGPGEILYSQDHNVGQHTLNMFFPKDGSPKQNSGDISSIIGASTVMSGYTIFSKESIYVTTEDHSLFSLDKNLKIVWKKKKSSGDLIPLLDSMNIYTSEGAIEQKDSNLLWNLNKTLGIVKDMLIASNTLYVGSTNGLYALDSSNGEIKWKLEIDDYTKEEISPTQMNIDQKGRIYFCNKANNLVYSVCANSPLNPNDPWPMQRHDPGNTRNFNVPIK